MKQEKTSTYKHDKTKKRNWTFVLYPESAPENWKEIIQKTGLKVAISPLHDKDKNPSGESKKPHYHVILCYNNTVTGRVVKELVDELNQPIPLPIDSVKGLYRYLTHKDNPEKAQYDEKDITTLNGFDILDYADLSVNDKAKIKVELIKFIREKELNEYSDFIDKVIELDKPDYALIAMTNTIFFNTYLTSIRNRNSTARREYIYIDRATGEVLEDSKDEPEILEKKEK